MDDRNPGSGLLPEELSRLLAFIAAHANDLDDEWELLAALGLLPQT
jgi:hypothetical protein